MVDAVFYNSLAETALRLIEQFGRDDLSFVRGSGATVDPVTDEETAGTTLTQPIKCIVLPFTPSKDNTFNEGTLVESRYRTVKFAAQGLDVFEPNEGDTIQFENATWTVRGVTPVSPAGIPLVYTATVERG